MEKGVTWNKGVAEGGLYYSLEPRQFFSLDEQVSVVVLARAFVRCEIPKN